MTYNEVAPRRILLVNCYQIGGGAESVFRDNVEIATKLGHHVQTYVGAQDASTNPSNLFEYVFSRKHRRGFLNAIRSFKPEIIHIHGLSHLLSPSILHAIRTYRKKFSVRTIYTAHDYHLFSPNSGAYYFRRSDSKLLKIDQRPTLLECLFRKWDHRGEAHSVAKILQWVLGYKILGLASEIDLVVCPSKFMASMMSKACPDSQIQVLFNPVPLRDNPPSIREANKIPRILFFGRISFEKGLSNFLDAVSDLPVKHEMTIVGDGPILHSLRCEWENQNVRFAGRTARDLLLSDLPNYDIFVLPSLWYENAPLSIIEAGNAGLLVATSNFGGMPEIASHLGGGNFETFDPNSAASIRIAITKLISSLSNRSPTFPDLHEFSFESYASQIQRMYSIQ